MLNNNYSNRMFQSPDDIITGKSIVLERNQSNAGLSDVLLSNPWPFGLSDYLQGFINKTVQVKYMWANGNPYEKQGVLVVVGSNFIGIQPNGTQDLLIIESSQVRSINIINYKKGIPLKRGQNYWDSECV